MLNYEDEQLKSNISFYLEKMRDFGFEIEESIILLMNAAEKTNADKIMEVVDFLEPAGSGCVREDIDKETARKEIAKILVED